MPNTNKDMTAAIPIAVKYATMKPKRPPGMSASRTANETISTAVVGSTALVTEYPTSPEINADGVIGAARIRSKNPFSKSVAVSPPPPSPENADP